MVSLIANNFSSEAMQAPKDPSKRRAFAGLILRIQDDEEKAIEALKQLALLSVEFFKGYRA